MTLFDPPAGEPTPLDPALIVRVRATVAYHGGGFRGFAAQPGQRTVSGALAEALQRVLRRPVEITCAGRTDAGVHAWGQVISFDAPAEPGGEALDLNAVKRAVNKQLKAQLHQVLELSIAYESMTMLTHDYAAATKAFANKETPVFKGY